MIVDGIVVKKTAYEPPGGKNVLIAARVTGMKSIGEPVGGTDIAPEVNSAGPVIFVPSQA